MSLGKLEIENWEVSESKTFSDTYIKPYFKVVQEYEPSEMPPDYHIYCHNGDICEGYGLSFLLKN